MQVLYLLFKFLDKRLIVIAHRNLANGGDVPVDEFFIQYRHVLFNVPQAFQPPDSFVNRRDRQVKHRSNFLGRFFASF
jgi:hypothetical protein